MSTVCTKRDDIVSKFVKQTRHYGQIDFGRLRFPTGKTNLTYTTPSEKTYIVIKLFICKFRSLYYF